MGVDQVLFLSMGPWVPQRAPLLGGSAHRAPCESQPPAHPHGEGGWEALQTVPALVYREVEDVGARPAPRHLLPQGPLGAFVVCGPPPGVAVAEPPPPERCGVPYTSGPLLLQRRREPPASSSSFSKAKKMWEQEPEVPRQHPSSGGWRRPWGHKGLFLTSSLRQEG